MHPQRFKVLVEEVHRKWLSTVFGGIGHHANGIDLRAAHFGIELKGRMREFYLRDGTVRHCHERFTLHDEQVEHFQRVYGSHLELFFCFLRYSLRRPVCSLPAEQHDVEKFIYDREAWFVPWAFADTYPVSSGTRVPYRYVPFCEVVAYATQENFRRVDYADAHLHVPRASPLEHVLDPSTVPEEDIPF